MLNHVIVKKGSDFVGRYAVIFTENSVKLRTVAGQALPHELLADVLQAVDIDCLARASKLHEQRKHPWRVRVRKGMSGCLDFWIEFLKNLEFRIIGKGCKLHISMNGKFNEGVDIPLMDLSPILNCDEFPEGWEHDHSEYSFTVIPECSLPNLQDFYPAGADSFGNAEEIEVDKIVINEEA
jgi:hypothetical protein